MPKTLAKETCLDGKATLVVFERDPATVFLRVYRSETESYSTRKIPGASSLEEARHLALDTFLEIGAPNSVTKPRRGPVEGTTKKPKKTPITDYIDRWMEEQLELLTKGLIKPNTYRSKKQSIDIIRLYLREEKILLMSQIKPRIFDRYEIFRSTQSKWTRRRELKVLKQFINYLAKHELIDPLLSVDREFVPKVSINDEDLDSNPPWRDSDLKLFWKEVHRWVKDAEINENGYILLIRRQVWTFYKTLRDSGLRPVEALNLKWSDLQFVNAYRFSQTKFDLEIGDLQKQGLPYEHLFDLPNDHPEKFELGKVDRFVVHISTLDTKTKRNRLVTCNGADALLRWKKWITEAVNRQVGSPDFNPSSPVFATPEQGEWRVLTNHTYQRYFRDVLMKNLEGKLKGPEMTRKPYKVYSFRSTRAQEMKAQGVEIGLAANQMGHSVDMMQRVYARLPVKERAIKEAAQIDYGRRKLYETLEIFDEN